MSGKDKSGMSSSHDAKDKPKEKPPQPSPTIPGSITQIGQGRSGGILGVEVPNIGPGNKDFSGG